ncbi:hypothetical protein ABW19_dt0200010 [Dactylella cylindrospora]|nr:hypothetical protein ABW19_dt0200010 [Dactylella cylindrospora]
MSYAEVVARGGPQDPEDLTSSRKLNSAAPPLDTVIPTDSSVASLIDVDTGVSVVSSDFPDQEVKTYTQAERLELEAAVAEEEEAARKAAAKKKQKDKAKDIGNEILVWFKDPVNSGNAVVSTVLAVTLGVLGYRRVKAGTFGWKTAGVGAAILAGFSLADFYATQ